MAKHLSENIGEQSYDRLIAGTNPAVLVASGIVKALTAEAEYKRGTVLSKDAAGKLSIMDTGGTPDCILCDDEMIGTSDTEVAVYVLGAFNEDALTVATGYTLTVADKDKLRERGIYLRTLLD